MTSALVGQAARASKRMRPAYTDLLDFYERIFAAQEDAGHISTEPITILPETQPLVNPSEFAIDIGASTNLLTEICRIAQTANETMASAASRLTRALESGKLDPKTFFPMISGEKDEEIETLAAELEIAEDILVFFGYHSIRPSLIRYAKRLSTSVDENRHRDKSRCPICGKEPDFSVLRGEGERFLICGFCETEWQARRIFCPFCENTDSETLSYLGSDQEEEYRIHICERCGRYLKTLDIRKISRPVYLPLERVSTLHLDMIAADHRKGRHEENQSQKP